MFKLLTEWLLLWPPSQVEPPRRRQRRLIPFRDHEHHEHQVEIWSECCGADAREPELFVLKLLGTASIAETADCQPASLWPDLPSEIWVMNPPGYGGAGGQAELDLLAPAAEVAYREMRRHAAGRPVLLYGNSLGALPALHLLATQPDIPGAILRDPPPLDRLLDNELGWWNFGVLPEALAATLPPELDAVATARRGQSPVLFVRSEQDQRVPEEHQRLVQEAYGGPGQEFVVAGAEHADPIEGDCLADYARASQWLLNRLGLSLPHADGNDAAAENQTPDKA